MFQCFYIVLLNFGFNFLHTIDYHLYTQIKVTSSFFTQQNHYYL